MIIASVRQAKAKRFDLSPTGLVTLKKAGVSNAVIAAMQGSAETTPDPPAPPAPHAAPPPAPPAASPAEPAPVAVPAVVASDEGVYYRSEKGPERIEAKTPYQTRTGSTVVNKLTLGIKAARLNAMLPGPKADLQVVGTPTFLLHVDTGQSVGEYYLVMFTVKGEQAHRELEVGSAGLYKLQSGFAEKDLFLTDARRLQKDIYLITPKSALPPGEYGLLLIPQVTGSGQTGLTPRKIFDFGVR